MPDQPYEFTVADGHADIIKRSSFIGGPGIVDMPDMFQPKFHSLPHPVLMNASRILSVRFPLQTRLQLIRRTAAVDCMHGHS
jgi:hypothetical protein